MSEDACIWLTIMRSGDSTLFFSTILVSRVQGQGNEDGSVFVE